MAEPVKSRDWRARVRDVKHTRSEHLPDDLVRALMEMAAHMSDMERRLQESERFQRVLAEEAAKRAVA